MPTIRQIVFGLVFATGILFPGQGVADRAPRPEERSRIETMLRNEGYTHWGKIELDDDDDARHGFRVNAHFSCSSSSK
jgi:hypothetical protein